jgi:hypothetical protein
VTEYLRQAALPYDWALKSPALMGLCRAQKVQDDVRGNRARGDWTFCSHFVPMGHHLLDALLEFLGR